MKSNKFFGKNMIKISIFFLSVFAISFTILYVLDMVPDELKVQDITVKPDNVKATTTINKVVYELPIKIVIDKIGVNSIVQNPQTTNVYTLDDLLLKGVVRYPGSGLPGEGNMFMFGHSTGFKVVKNQAFKAFNNLNNLVKGDEIKVYSESTLFRYSVAKVRLADADDVLVDFSVKKNMLTLSTCNTFGQKQERYVVEADFVESSAL